MSSKMKNFIYLFIITIFTSNNLFSQSFGEWSNEMILWQCKSDPSIKLMYRVNIGEGGNNSFIELIKPETKGEFVISGILKVEENKKRDNYSQNTTKTEVVKIDQNSMDKQYLFDFSYTHQISFEGTCINMNPEVKVNSDAAKKYDFNEEWSPWVTLWEVEKDTIKVMYRTKNYFDKNTKTKKTDIQIQGPENYSNGVVSIHGNIKTPNNPLGNSFILTEMGFSKTLTLKTKDFSPTNIILSRISYFRKKIKHVSVDAPRG